MMRLTPHGDQRFDPRFLASRDIRRAEIARVRQQRFGVAQCFRQRADLVQHRLDLPLVVRGLNHIDGDDQQASRGDGGLRVVALVEAAAGHRHDARFFVGEIDLIVRPRPLGWRLWRLAAGLLARGRRLGRARREFGFMLGKLPRMALLGARLDLGARFGELAQTLLAQRQFVGNRHAVGNVGCVRRLGFGHQIGDFGLQLRLDLAGMLIGKRAVPAGVGVDFRAVEPDRSQLQNAHLARQQQHLNEQRLDLFQEPPPETRDRVVVGMIVGGEETERHASRRSHAPACGSKTRPSRSRKPARPAASGMVRRRTGAAISADHGAQIETVDHLRHEARQMLLRQPIVHRWRKQKPSPPIKVTEVVQVKGPSKPGRISSRFYSYLALFAKPDTLLSCSQSTLLKTVNRTGSAQALIFRMPTAGDGA